MNKVCIKPSTEYVDIFTDIEVQITKLSSMDNELDNIIQESIVNKLESEAMRTVIRILDYYIWEYTIVVISNKNEYIRFLYNKTLKKLDLLREMVKNGYIDACTAYSDCITVVYSSNH